MAVVFIINRQTSKDPALMKLVRRLVLRALRFNILFRAHHIPGVDNIAADHLSRLQIQEFRKSFPNMDKLPTVVEKNLLEI
jgi:hypothetical protein